MYSRDRPYSFVNFFSHNILIPIAMLVFEIMRRTQDKQRKPSSLFSCLDRSIRIIKWIMIKRRIKLILIYTFFHTFFIFIFLVAQLWWKSPMKLSELSLFFASKENLLRIPILYSLDFQTICHSYQFDTVCHPLYVMGGNEVACWWPLIFYVI